jgi:DNA-binding LacI/PurR family transcriptional regulator
MPTAQRHTFSPQRPSLPRQVAEHLRQKISDGLWHDALPSEMTLCRELQVSRVTLRAALAMLADEGLVSVSQGSRRRILQSGPKRNQKLRRVMWLSRVPVEKLSHWLVQVLAELRERLRPRGIVVDVVVSLRVFSVRPEKALRSLLAEHPHAVWVLPSVPLPAQRWFAQQAGVKAVLAGSRHDSLDMPPCVEEDFAAVGRHAAGLLMARGHRRLALLMPPGGSAGDAQTIAGFREAAAGAEVLVCEHDGSKTGLIRRLDALLKGQRPSALFVAGAGHTLTVLTHLLSRGLRIPQDLSLLSRDHDVMLDHTTPALTCYQPQAEAFGRALAKSVTSQIDGRRPPDARLFPDAIRGETLRRV